MANENVRTARAMKEKQRSAFRLKFKQEGRLVGTIEVRTCKATGQSVEMYYVGFSADGGSLDGSGGANGNPGWLCLHDD